MFMQVNEIIETMEKGHLYPFVSMGRIVIGFINVANHIYCSNYSLTNIYKYKIKRTLAAEMLLPHSSSSYVLLPTSITLLVQIMFH